jgi:CheY-like chemotaxis protein
VKAKNTKQNGKNILILLVEDDDINGRVIGRYLKELYNVDWVKTGEQALELVHQKNYDCILMDISLSGSMDGLMTTERIRKIPGYENTPVVAVTAYAMPGDEEKFLSRGCSHYIAKPFTHEEILTLLKSILHG